MFLKKVFLYNKWMFSGMVVFIIMQLVCFYKQGMEFTPWHNYGMFSAKSYPQTKYDVYYLPYKYGPNTRFFFPYKEEKLFGSLAMFQNQEYNNQFFSSSVLRICNKIGFRPSPAHYTIHVNETNFKKWFNNYATYWIYPSDKAINEYFQKAIWDGNILKLAVDSMQGGNN